MIDLWSHFHGDTAMRSQLADRIAENDALRDENERLRARVAMLENVLDLCRATADTGLRYGDVDSIEDGNEAQHP